MKLLPKIILSCLGAAALSSAAFGETAQEFLTLGQAAYLKGDIETAKQNFEFVYQLDPRNRVAIDFLRRIKAQEAKSGAPAAASLEKQLAGIIVPKVEFRDASVGAAVEFLRQTVTKQTGGKMTANFVLQIPPEQANTQKVTLSLANVPLTEVVRYLADGAGLTVRYERHAITLRPSAASTAAIQPAPKEAQ